MSDAVKYLLDETHIPKRWYNLMADLPSLPPPVLHPGTLNPVGPDDLAPLFPMSLILQEVSTEREIDIPEPVRQVYRQWRPSPLFRARRLERALETPARIDYKYEGVSPAGSHKPNTALAQAFYNKEAGVRRISTETGAGQWGSPSRSPVRSSGSRFRCSWCVSHTTRSRIDAPSWRRSGRAASRARQSRPISAGRYSRLRQTATAASGSRFRRRWKWPPAATIPSTRLARSSITCSCIRRVIGQEAMAQMELASDYPDIVIGCTGGGSNFAGIAFPFIGAALRGGSKVRVIAVEPAACPSLTRGRYAYDFGDTGHMTPLARMHTLGSTFMPPGFHAGGLRYHGMAPLVSHLKELGLIEARAYHQTACFEAGVYFARQEGIVPAPEANHAVKAAIDEAVRCKEQGAGRAILFNLSGHGHFDMQAYQDYFDGKLSDQKLRRGRAGDGAGRVALGASLIRVRPGLEGTIEKPATARS